MPEAHAHVTESRLHLTSGVRVTGYDVAGEKAHLIESGLGVAFDATPWLQLSAEGRYGWFGSDSIRTDGWLPPRAGVELHFPLNGGWEIGFGAKTQFPGVEPLAVREWELAPEVEIRYDRGGWYAGVMGEVSWILGAGEEEGAELGGEHAGESAATHAGHGEIHDVIDQHGETEFVWQAALGARLLDERLTLEGRVVGNHVVEGESEARHYLRAGARAIYRVNERAWVFLDGSIPASGPRRNQWQTSMALRLSF